MPSVISVTTVRAATAETRASTTVAAAVTASAIGSRNAVMITPVPPIVHAIQRAHHRRTADRAG